MKNVVVLVLILWICFNEYGLIIVLVDNVIFR